jgi:hypothetical protein
MNGEKGQALPLAILALTIGALVVAPFLGHAGSSLIGSRVYGETIGQQNACDAGVEHAIWSLTRGSLAGAFTEPGDEVTYELDETVNGLDVTVTVTANTTGGGGTAGEITDTVIDTLTFDTSSGYTPEIVQVSNNVYVIAYSTSNNKGYLKTVSIAANGDIGNSVIDTLNFATSNCYEPNIIQVTGNIYAIAYRGSSSRGYLNTVSIAANGNIGSSVIDTLTFDISTCYEPYIVRVASNIFAIAYRGSSNRGYLKTVSIAANGDIGNSVIDTLIFDTSAGYEPSIIYVSGNVYAIAYRGSSNRGYLKTVTIAANGDIGNSVISTLTFDTSASYEPSIINVSGSTYAIVYRTSTNNGLLKTVSIAANGVIGGSVIDSFSFDSYGYEPRIINVSNDIYAIAYRGPSYRGNLKTISIAADGNIANAFIDTLEFDSSSCYEPAIINVSGDIFGIVYRGPSNDGFVKTVEITSTGATAAAYEIDASAGERTIRAFINTDNTTVRVISWQIE